VYVDGVGLFVFRHRFHGFVVATVVFTDANDKVNLAVGRQVYVRCPCSPPKDGFGQQLLMFVLATRHAPDGISFYRVFFIFFILAPWFYSEPHF